MTDEGDFRVGDVLLVACPFTVTRVAQGVMWDHVSVQWPWWEIDTENEFAHWNGVVALGVNSGGSVSPGVEAELFQLKAGDVRRVGVPPTVVHVTDVEHHAPRWRQPGCHIPPRPCPCHIASPWTRAIVLSHSIASFLNEPSRPGFCLSKPIRAAERACPFSLVLSEPHRLARRSGEVSEAVPYPLGR